MGSTVHPLRVLVCCEFSGIVREAFKRLGHDAVSCDLLPTEIPGRHFVADAFEVLSVREWDLVIAHPPCTYLCNSGVRWLYGKGKSAGVRDEARWAALREGAAFMRGFFERFAGRLCVENPIMHSHAAALVGEPAGAGRRSACRAFGGVAGVQVYECQRVFEGAWPSAVAGLCAGHELSARPDGSGLRAAGDRGATGGNALKRPDPGTGQQRLSTFKLSTYEKE